MEHLSSRGESVKALSTLYSTMALSTLQGFGCEPGSRPGASPLARLRFQLAHSQSLNAASSNPLPPLRAHILEKSDVFRPARPKHKTIRSETVSADCTVTDQSRCLFDVLEATAVGTLDSAALSCDVWCSLQSTMGFTALPNFLCAPLRSPVS